MTLNIFSYLQTSRLSLPRRWLKFEEDVEDGGERWSKPYVATLSLHSLFELRSCIINGSVLLDMHADSIEEIAGDSFDSLTCTSQFQGAIYSEKERQAVCWTLLGRHQFVLLVGATGYASSNGYMISQFVLLSFFFLLSIVTSCSGPWANIIFIDIKQASFLSWNLRNRSYGLAGSFVIMLNVEIKCRHRHTRTLSIIKKPKLLSCVENIDKHNTCVQFPRGCGSSGRAFRIRCMVCL